MKAAKNPVSGIKERDFSMPLLYHKRGICSTSAENWEFDRFEYLPNI